jgi:GTP-binding protein
MAKRIPVVALVGRPNVGKSTLFNRLAGERLAVVDETPGTTRDRLHSHADWGGVDFIVVDTGGIDPTEVKIGTGREPLSIGSREFINEIRTQAEIAIQDADAVLMLVDVESGITPADEEVARILRRNQKEVDGELFPPVLLVVNKCDNASRREQAYEFYSMGLGEIYPVSAQHGQGTGDMLDALVTALKATATGDQDDMDEDDSVKIAIVGKPNAGKSSLLNKLLGQDRAIVSPIAGTTRDAVDEFITYNGLPVTLIDTAGIRRRGKVEPGVEKYSVLRAMRAIERSDVALLVVDATTGITKQDFGLCADLVYFCSFRPAGSPGAAHSAPGSGRAPGSTDDCRNQPGAAAGGGSSPAALQSRPAPENFLRDPGQVRSSYFPDFCKRP